MQEYVPIVMLGVPPVASAIELASFSVVRGESNEIVGFAISADEIADPISEIWVDVGSRSMYLQSTDKSIAHVLPGAEVPDDVFAALIGAAQQGAFKLTLYALPLAPAPEPGFPENPQ
jgi:hypothetical protein